MTSLDWMILAGIALAAAGGFRRGFIVGGLGLAGFAAGVLLGVQAAAALEERSPLVAPALFPAVGGLLGGALLARVGDSLRWRKAATPPPPARRRDRLVRTAPEMLDRVLGAALTAGVACGLAWLAGAAALQVAAPRDVREAVRESVILAELNAVLPPTAPILDAVARFDPFPRLRGPSAEVAAPPSRVGRDRDVRSARDSVVRVVGTACGQGMSGSGWIAGRGLVVTNAHVISGQDDTQVQPAGEGDVLDAVPVAIDERNDVAVLRVAGLDGRPLPMAPDPKSGVPVAVLGFPGDGAYSVRSARLGATRTVVMSEPSAQRLVRRSITLFRGTVRPGNSGGPLVDRAGRVAATVFATRREQASRTGFAVPNEAVRRALNAAAAPVDTGACADPVAQVELLQDVRDVGLDGRVADVELLPDLGVRVTVGDEAEDVELTLGQLLEIFRRRGMGNARELLDHPFRDGGREERLSAGDDADGGEELFGRVVLEDEPAGAGPECLVDVFCRGRTS